MDREEQRRALEAYVRERLQREEHAHGRGYRADMARKARVSAPHVTNIMRGETIGYDAALAFGAAWGMTPSELLSAAAGPEPSAPLPNLETAIAVARPPFSPQAVAIARRIGSTSRDFSVALWTILLGEVEADLADATSDGAMSLSDGSVTISCPGRSHTRT